MGYDEQPVWRRYRDSFPVTLRLIYLHHAGVAPLSKPAADAMRELADEASQFGSYHYDAWLATYAALRRSAARLIGADAGEIALVKNTSEGIATVAIGLDWRPGDKVIAFREEFPANYFPWKRLEARGVNVQWLSIHDGLDRVDEACRGARLLSISFVQYLSGYRADLGSIGEICRRHGCLFMVDAIQGLGAFPVDVRKAGIHFLAADGHKWLLGPEGCGILYIHKDLQDQVEPVEFGWTNVAGYNDYASRDMALRPDAGRYECGTLNTIGCYGLRAAIDFLLEIGVERIAPAVQALGDQIAEGVVSRDYELLVARTPASGAGIVSFRKEGVDSRLVVSRLKEQGIIAAPRQGWVRASPHFYISPEEIDRMIQALP
ncbi:MAG TPA: aminotransferase class V-fold PLP-dependent enzyme [Bryobacteraceae bacterium]|nr:aminotransferase class V-fold PLP-dependent enzyme [Bryobacteraceae bacterium]